MMKVVIIGVGVSGLVFIKCCLDEGFEFVCFEKCFNIGGLWKFFYEVGGGLVYEFIVINMSKEMMCFLDFFVLKYFLLFMLYDDVVKYLYMYVEYFDLFKYIYFNIIVLEIS